MAHIMTTKKRGQMILEKCDGETVSHTFEITRKNGVDLNYFMLVFDAHGNNADEYYMSNLKVEVNLE